MCVKVLCVPQVFQARANYNNLIQVKVYNTFRTKRSLLIRWKRKQISGYAASILALPRFILPSADGTSSWSAYLIMPLPCLPWPLFKIYLSVASHRIKPQILNLPNPHNHRFHSEECKVTKNKQCWASWFYTVTTFPFLPTYSEAFFSHVRFMLQSCQITPGSCTPWTCAPGCAFSAWHHTVTYTHTYTLTPAPIKVPYTLLHDPFQTLPSQGWLLPNSTSYAVTHWTPGVQRSNKYNWAHGPHWHPWHKDG